MTEPSQQKEFSPPQINWWWSLLTLVVVSVCLGTYILAFAKEDLVPYWVQITAIALMLVLTVIESVRYFRQIRKYYSIEVLGHAARVAFKPYILWASVAFMTLTWVVALIIYNSVWLFVALGTTVLVFILGFFSLRRLVQQIESTETDIL